jgi:hypothetical protein
MKTYGELRYNSMHSYPLYYESSYSRPVRFTPPHSGKEPRNPLDRRLGGPQFLSGRCWEGESLFFFFLPGIETRFSRWSSMWSSHYTDWATGLRSLCASMKTMLKPQKDDPRMVGVTVLENLNYRPTVVLHSIPMWPMSTSAKRFIHIKIMAAWRGGGNIGNCPGWGSVTGRVRCGSLGLLLSDLSIYNYRDIYWSKLRGISITRNHALLLK